MGKQSNLSVHQLRGCLQAGASAESNLEDVVASLETEPAQMAVALQTPDRPQYVGIPGDQIARRDGIREVKCFCNQAAFDSGRVAQGCLDIWHHVRPWRDK
jgi:hypothetical protein